MMQIVRSPFFTSLVAILVLWIALSFSPPARAGTYSVTYSDGQVVVTDSIGNSSTTPYFLNGKTGEAAGRATGRA